jgi:predicted nicotinamide N-methyase
VRLVSGFLFVEMDLQEDGDQEPMSVLDLPQLYQEPPAERLLEILDDLKLAPPSWDAIPIASRKRQISDEGVPAYLTNIVSSPLSWIYDDQTKERIWESASERLSERSGRTGRGDLTRTFNIPLDHVGEHVLTITLHEPALQADNLGLKTWASSYLLAKRLTVLRNSLPKLDFWDTILELGSGTGLVGLAAAAILKSRVLLTDLPEIVTNLQHNATTNADAIVSHGGSAQTSILDWSQPRATVVAPAQASFPLILAADPIYSTDHPRLLAQVIEYHLARVENARVVIELPLRQAYVVERRDLRERMDEIGLEIVEEGEEIGFDDWGCADERTEVRCWWNVWAWKK